jgi:hypothetical protein
MYFPTHLKRMMLISLCFVTLGLASCSTRAQTDATTSMEKKPSDIVREYAAKAGAGQFDKLAALTAPKLGKKGAKPEEGSKPSTATGSNGATFTMVPDEAAAQEGYKTWILRDFPTSITEQKLVIKVIKHESVEGDHARVHVLFGNDQKTDVLGWVFVMTRIEGNWLIKDITTPGDTPN